LHIRAKEEAVNLYILRHAIAVERGLPEYEDDSQRPLTGKGRKRMAKMAKGMQALDLDFDLILSSPFSRARQTAEIVAEELDMGDELQLTDHLAPEGDPAALVAFINEQYGDKESVVLVGHEPYLSGLISTLIAGMPNIPINLKKGGLCCLTVEALSYGQCATLEWLLAPRQLLRAR
jgi:phosphohistidine phosphatase